MYIHRHVILHRDAKFHQNRGVITSNRFLIWWPWSQKSTSGFGFSYGTRFGRLKSTYLRNFD